MLNTSSRSDNDKMCTITCCFCILIIIGIALTIAFTTDVNGNKCPNYKTIDSCENHVSCETRDIKVNVNGTTIDSFECYSEGTGVVLIIVIPFAIILFICAFYFVSIYMFLKIKN